MKSKSITACLGAVVVSMVLALGGVAGAAQAPKQGGSLTVVTVNSQWLTLDPATNTQDSADVSYMNSIYGELFYESPQRTLVPDLATGYKFSNDNKTVTISIRHGVTFQDGTPFDAAAVAANIRRVLTPSFGCICASAFTALKSVTTPDKYSVVLHLSKPDASIIQAFIQAAPNWVPSPTALGKEPEATFGQHPIGAGPFEVVSNTASTQLVLKRFPQYWDKSHPYVDNLTFTSVSTDQSAFQALQSNTAQIAIGIGTVPIYKEAKGKFNLTTAPGAFSSLIYFNTKVAPFNNKMAREAAIYATNPKLVQQAMSPGYGVVVQTPSGPGSDYYQKTSPGYRTYNLAKAKALVKQLGGMSVSIIGLNTTSAQAELETLQTQWKAAGIDVSLRAVTQQEQIQALDANDWTASTANAGNIDPDLGASSLANRFGSAGSFSCCKDSVLDRLIDRSQTTIGHAARAKIFKKAYARITKEAYGDFLFAPPTVVISSKSVTGLAVAPGTNTASPLIEFENIALTS